MSSNQFNNKKVYSVSNITSHIQQLFKSDPLLQNVTIVGELSNFKYHSSGHMYFVLKDDKSQIKCVMFRGSNLGLSFNPCDGMGVRATGDIRVYEKRGEYQFYVMQMVEVGKGALFAAFEQLKLKLKAEGLFRQDIKKTLPKIPRKIAVITSPTGAAIRDIISVTLRRFPNIHIIVVPAQVQGNEAASQISDNIKFLNKVLPNLDFIIIGRGGGSIEELWAFNEEILAREIYHSTIPIVSAVGHETDFTISDFVADLRAPTPSGAAEMTIPDMESLVMNVSLVRSKLNRIVKYILELKEQKYFTVFESLRYQNPKSKIMQHTQTLDDLITRLNLNIKHIININENILNKYREKIITLSPKGVLKRGYSICFKIPERTIIKKTKQIKKNDNIDVMVSDGIISANVTERRSVNE
jgi:exodeoxyribonuclease VII large subunit